MPEVRAIGGVMERILLIVVIAYLTANQRLSSSAFFAAAAGAKDPYPFLTGDAAKASARTYDYIIVGGGAAGCPLAATLSRTYSVLVLERGDSPYGNPDIEKGTEFLKPLSENDKYYSIAQTFVTEDGVNGARGRVLGGTTTFNAGYYSRGSAEDIAEMRAWDEQLVNESYAWVEKELTSRPTFARWQLGVRDALLEKGVGPYNGYTLDHLPGTKFSASTVDRNGKRHTAADLLKYANPLNIVVLLNATAKRVLFSPAEDESDLARKPRAAGVEFVNKENTVSHKVYLKTNGEVILSAGALGSPQLLLLSGIGPSQHLKDFGIPVIVDLPGVGKGIGDTPRTDIRMLSKEPLEFSLVQVAGIPKHLDIYVEALSKLQVQPVTEYAAYIGTILYKLAHPLSRGVLRLRSLDPRDNPSVRYNYFSHPRDLRTCIQAVRLLASLNQSKPLQQFAYKNASEIPRHLLPVLRTLGPPFPKNSSDDAALGRFCRVSMVTIWHYRGGCNIGSVIDENHSVIGVDGLRVLDASTFKSAPGTNPQATILMLGRYKGVQILRQRLQNTISTGSGIDGSSARNAY